MMKKRYNKLVAYLLMDFSTVGVVALPLGLVAFIVTLATGEKENIAMGVSALFTGVFCLLVTFLLTLYINSRTPKGERVGTWLRAWWLGFKIAWKIALCCTLVLIPAMLKWSINIDSCDLTSNWNKGERFVYDENGNSYEVMDSEHIKDESGNWHKVWTDSNDYKFI
ncbi:MAG: solute carrier organic anion transporter [Ruminococcus sp.]|nr:solute carrier organic anion transporter [Ruminococcus sp.]